MSVVIDEFEAVADTAASATPPPSNGAPKPKIKASELRAPLHRLAQRRARIWAH
jgi:hypothetical protein